MKIKNNLNYIISFDLDGTLLNDNLSISQYSKKILKKLFSNHYICIINSSRTLKDILKILSDLNFSYIIALNGAVIYDNINKKIINHFEIKNEVKNQLINFILQKKICANIFSLENNYITYFAIDNINNYYQKSLNPVILNKIPEENILSIELILKNKEELIIQKNELVKIFNNKLSIIESNYNYLEIHSTKIDKYKAVKYLSEILCINEKNIISLGDSNTDKDLIKHSGIGIAMKNSSKELLSVADEISEYDNNNDGAVKHILQILDIK